MCRFVLLNENGIYFTEGIRYPNHKEGWVEPNIAINRSGVDIKVLQAKPDRKPWRELTSLISFIVGQNDFECQQLKYGVDRARKANVEMVNVWSGGIRVSGDAFGQKVRGTDDYVESEIKLHSKWLGEIWFTQLKSEMTFLEDLSKIVFGTTMAYFKHQLAEGKDQASQASILFWQLCERKFQALVNACGDNSGEKAKAFRSTFAGYVNKAYDTYCPRETARQLDAWAANRPNLGKYVVKK